MTEPLQSLLLELLQTREFTAGEKGDLTRLWEKLLWRDGVGQLYTVLVYLWYGFAIFLGISVLMAVKPLAIVAPDRSAQLALAAIGFAAFFASAQWLGNRLSRSKFWTELRAGDRYAIVTDGVRADTHRGALSCGWNHIQGILNDGHHLIALLPGNSGLFIVKAAFDGQDVEGFCAELECRWQQNRNSPQPEPAP